MKFLSRFDDFESIIVDGDVQSSGLSSLYIKDTNNAILRIGSTTGDSFITYDGSELSISSDVDLRLTTPTDQDVFLITSSGNISTTAGGGTFTIGGGLTLSNFGAGYLKTDANGVVSIDTDIIEDTLDSVTDRGNTTTNAISTGAITSSGTITSSNGTLGAVHFVGSSYKIEGGSNVGDLRYTAPRHRWYEDTTFVMTIDGGKVGIGTTNPAEMLDVVKTGTQLGTSGYYYNTRIKDATNSGILAGGNATENGVGFVAGINELAFLTYGNSAWGERMRITGTGNVGIGTTSPTGYTSSNVVLHIHTALTNSDLKLTNGTTGTGAVAGGLIRQDGNQMYIWNASNGFVAFGANNGERMRITNAGNVGIGTTSPNTRLHVADNSTGVTMRIQNSGTGNESSLRFQALSSTSTQEYADIALDPLDGDGALLFRNPYTSERMRIDASGNVGIGTNSPGAQLHVNSASSSATSVYVGNTGTGVSRAYFDASNGDFSGGDYMWIGQNNDLSGEIVMTQSAGAFHIKTQPGGTITSRLTVLQDGNVGIGTTSPGAKLHIYGGGNTIFEAPADTDVDIRYRSNGTNKYNMFYQASTDGWGLYYNPSTAYRLFVNSSGNVGIGTNTPSQTLDVNGTSYFRNSVGINGEGNGITVDSGYGVNGRVGLMKYGGLEGMLISGSATKLRLGRRTDSTTVATAGTPTVVVDIQINTDGVIQFPEYGAGLLKTDADGKISLDTTTYLPSSSYVAPAIEAGGGTPVLATGVTAAEIRTLIDVDVAGTDNSTNVTLATVTGNYLTISGQEITAGTVPVSLGGTGATTAADARTNLGVDPAGTDNSTNVTLVTTSHDYLSITGQAITLDAINLDDINGGSTAGILKTDASGVLSIDTSTYLTAEADTLQSVTTRGSSTSTSISTNGGKLVLRDDSIENHVTNGNAAVVFNYYGYATGTTQFRDTIFYNGKNSAVMFVDGSASSVGIGTTSPFEKLHVNGRIYVTSNPGSDGIVLAGSGSTNTPYAYITSTNEGVQDVGMAFYVTTDAGTTNTEAIRIDDQGNVGIGTTNPSEKLDVSGNIKLSGRLYVDSSSSVSITPSAGDWIDIAELGYGEHHGKVAIEWNSLYAPSSAHHGWAEFEVGTYYSSSYNYGWDTYVELSKVLAHNDFWLSAVRAVDYGSTVRIQIQASATVTQGTFRSVVVENNQGSITALSPAVNANTYTVLATANIGTVDGSNVQKSFGNTVRFSRDVGFDQKVGIGTTAPSQALDVSGNIVIPQGNFLSIRRSGFDNPILWQGNGTFGSADQLYLRQPNNNNLHLQTNGGNTRLLINGAGNVGINETSPLVPLHISRDSASGENIALLLDNNNTTAGNEIGMLFRSMVGSTNTDFEIFGVANAANDMDLVFQSDGSVERVRFTGDGKVGIGTNNPSYRFHLIDNTNSAWSTKLQSDTVGTFISHDSGYGMALRSTSSSSSVYLMNLIYGGTDTDTGGTSALFVRADGKVGIGTTDPARILTVSAPSGDTLSRTNAVTGSYAGLELTENNSTTSGQYWQINKVPTSHRLQLWNGSERLTVLSGGNTGIGVTNPQHRLHVDGGVASKRSASTTALNGQFLVYWDATYPTSQYLYGMDLGYNGTYRTRIFSPASYDVAISSAPNTSMGTQADYTDHMVVKGGTGDVGIGTISPDTKVHVVGTAETRLRVGSSNATSNVVLELRDENSPTGQGTVITYNNATGETYFNNALSTATTDFHFQSGEYGSASDFFTLSNAGGNSIVQMSTSTGDAFITYEGATNEMAIASDGDLRLTTPTDQDVFFISSGGNIDMTQAGGNVDMGGNLTVDGNITGNGSAYITGSLGIGTSSPSQKLDIVDGLLRFTNTTSGRNSTIGMDDNYNFYVKNTSLGNLYLGNTTTTYISGSLDVDGASLYVNKTTNSVGIGTTSPQQLLHIKGATSAYIMLEADSDTGTVGTYYKSEDTDDTMNRTKGFFGWQGQTAYGNGYFTMWLDTVEDNGAVTSSEEKFRWERDGDFHADGDVIAYSTTTPSDERLKDNIKTIENASEKIAKMRGVEYQWNTGKLTGKKEIGLIAQEVEAVVPEVVAEKKLPMLTGTDEVYKTVDYERLVALLIESNKELQNRITELESKVYGTSK